MSQAGTRPVALITGAARRIGLAIAWGLAEDGFAIALHCNLSSADAGDAVTEMRDSGHVAAVVRGDLRETQTLDGILDQAETIGPVHCLVNNASIFRFDAGDAVDLALFDEVMAVNLRAPLYLADRLSARLQDGQTGSVVNMLDQKVYNLNTDHFSYTIGRLGLERATVLQAMALAPRVRVNGVAPGLTLPEATQDQGHFMAIHDRTPLNRGSQVGDVVAAVRYLVSAPAVTGQIIAVDGGQRLRPTERDTLFQDA